MLVKCKAKTCVNYDNEICKAESLEIVNFTWYSEEAKEELDEMKCNTYEYYDDWMYRGINKESEQ